MKKNSIKDQREAKKAEMKEKYRARIKEDDNNTESSEIMQNSPSPTVSTISDANVKTELDIESKDTKITFYRICSEPKQEKQDKRSGKNPKIFIIGEYIDEAMRDRAFDALKTALANKHEIKDVGENNLCFIVNGVDSEFESIKSKVYKFDVSNEVNTLNRNRISRLFDVEV